jgi:hypothetical protein
MCQGKIYHQSLISRRFLVSTATTCRLCFAFEDEVMTHDPIYYIYALDVYVTLVLENILAHARAHQRLGNWVFVVLANRP